jgi:hypothetical protein
MTQAAECGYAAADNRRRAHAQEARPGVSGALRNFLGLLRRKAPPPEAPRQAAPPAAAPASPSPAEPPPNAGFYRLQTAQQNWVAAGQAAHGVSWLDMAETLDPAHAVIAILPKTHRQLCLIVAPDARLIAVRADGLPSIAVSALPLQSRASPIVRLQHPCLATRFMSVTRPGQGGPDGLLVFDSGAHTELDAFTLVPLAADAVPAIVSAIAREFSSVATQPFSARGLVDALRTGAVRAELAEALIRLLRPDEAAVLARDALEKPAVLAVLRRLLPGNPWAEGVLPALAAWNGTRSRVSPEGVLASPASDEFAGRPLQGHGMPQAGHVLTMLARAHTVPRYNACVLTGMRNDGIYLLDFVSYHLSIGFEHIFIYTNDNTDGSDELLHALAAHGVITVIDNSIGTALSPQQKYHAHGLMLLPQILDYRWTALIDSDEYVAFDTGMFGNIIDFITWQEAQAVDAIALCWVLHAAGVGDTWRDESALRRFPMRERSVNGHVKSFIRTNKFWHSHPHFPHTPLGRPFVFRTESGRIHHIHNTTERLAAFAESPSADFAWIAHYILRSAGEALLKLSRGRADQTGPAAVWQQSNLEFVARTFMSLSRPEGLVRDERILLCATGQAEVHASLMALPGVADIAWRLKAAMPQRLADAARSFLAGVPAEGQPDFVRGFRDVVARGM